MELNPILNPAFALLTKEEAGEFFLACLSYEKTMVAPTFKSRIASILFAIVKEEVDSRVRANEARKVGGRKGGRPRKKTSEKTNEEIKTSNDGGFSVSEIEKEKPLEDTDTQSVAKTKTSNEKGFSVSSEDIEREEESLFPFPPEPTLTNLGNNISLTKEEEKEKENSEKNSPPDLSYLQDKVLEDALTDWLAYKRERKESYKQRGLQALITSVRNQSGGDSQKVREAVDFSMANNYQGLIFPKNKTTLSRTEQTQREQSVNHYFD